MAYKRLVVSLPRGPYLCEPVGRRAPDSAAQRAIAHQLRRDMDFPDILCVFIWPRMGQMT